MTKAVVRGGAGVQILRIWGFRKREPKEKLTVYYYQHPQIWKPNDSSDDSVSSNQEVHNLYILKESKITIKNLHERVKILSN